MRFLASFSFALFTLGLAKESQKFYAAVLYGDDDYEFEVERGPCVNLKRNQPIFNELEVGNSDHCTVYANLKCDTKVQEFPAGDHDITDVVFKSIKCPAPETV